MNNSLLINNKNEDDDDYEEEEEEEEDLSISGEASSPTPLINNNYHDEELKEIDINSGVIITNGGGCDDDDDDDDDDDEDKESSYEERKDGNLIKLTKKLENSFSNSIMLSHLITRMGDKSWSFIIPLFLITLSPNSLLPVSLFGLSTYTFRILFGPTIGKLTDQFKKIQVIKLGIFTQAFAIGISCIVLFFLFIHVGIIDSNESTSTASTASTASTSNSESTSTLFSSGLSIFLFIFLLLLSSIHSLATQMMDISVERKWTPSIVKRDSRLTKVNTRMRQIDLGTEMLAPFLAGLIAQLCGSTAFIWIGIFNFFSFFPQYFLLKIVYDKISILNFKIDKDGLIDFTDGKEFKVKTIFYDEDNEEQEDEDNQDIITPTNKSNKSKLTFKEFLMGEWNPISNLIKGWIVFKQQSVFLVIIAYCLLWFTCLSPHDPVLTAYLSNNGYSYIELSIFRGLGAIFGLGSTLLFNKFVKYISNRTNGSSGCNNDFTISKGMNYTALLYILEEGLLVLISGFFFSSKNWLKYIFMTSIILSRCGLYGFEIIEIQYVQRLVDNKMIGLVSGVESSLCSLAILIMFILSSSLQSTFNFYILVWFSISFVLFGGFTFLIWVLKNNKNYSNNNNNNSNNSLQIGLVENI